MKKPTHSQAVTEASAMSVALKASDPRFNKGGVFLIHDDGSSFFWNSAFSVKWKGYLFVFAEHHGFVVYDNDDVVFTGDIAKNKRKG